jgi:hypothetical protein
MTRKVALLALTLLLMGLGLLHPAQRTMAGCSSITITNLTVYRDLVIVTYDPFTFSPLNVDFAATDQSSSFATTVGSGTDPGVTTTTGRVFSFALNPAQVAEGEAVQVTGELPDQCGGDTITGTARGFNGTAPPNLAAPAACDDGRINFNHCDKIAIYLVNDEDGVGLQVLIVDHLIVPRGAIFVSAAELDALPDNPARNTLIAQSKDGLVKFYKLAGGEYQINYGPDANNKVFVFRWTGMPPAAYPDVSTYIKAS